MRGILIDPVAECVSEVEYNNDYRQIYVLLSDESSDLKVDCFTTVQMTRRDTLFVDDEGLLKNPRYFFLWSGYVRPLAGRGLILGCNGVGESVSTKLKPEDVRRSITFQKLSVQGFKIEQGETTLYGEKATFVRSTPIFGKPERSH